MNNIWTICKREISAFFDSLVAYILLIAYFVIIGIWTWFAIADVFLSGQASLGPFFAISSGIFTLFVPAITMRSIAEEKRSGTLELLATKPVTDFQIVAGKWLACYLLVVISFVPTFVYYITVANIGPIDHGAVFGGYIGLMLLSGAFVSIGVLASSVTNNQIVALILGLVLSVFFFIMFDLLATVLPTEVANVLTSLSFQTHFNQMSRGVISLVNVVYFGSLIVLGLVLPTLSLRRRAWS